MAKLLESAWLQREKLPTLRTAIEKTRINLSKRVRKEGAGAAVRTNEVISILSTLATEESKARLRSRIVESSLNISMNGPVFLNPAEMANRNKKDWEKLESQSPKTWKAYLEVFENDKG